MVLRARTAIRDKTVRAGTKPVPKQLEAPVPAPIPSTAFSTDVYGPH
jgi:hypothetical protein